jgi:4-amino-4-deoxy-L-arabinose transferase-like glycosyltransferase
MTDFRGSPTASRLQLRLKPAHVYALVAAIAAAIYLGCIISPPSLFDDVDAVQAQIARNMLTSHDWVTARIDGLTYLDKAPAIYWLVGGSFRIFGVHDWAARIPMALCVIALCWVTVAFAMWAMGKRVAFYVGLCISTCVGLFLFTRILIPDALLTLTITFSLWAFLRALDEAERRPRLWAFLMAASLGLGLLAKSLIGLVFPVAIAAVYLLASKQMFLVRTWKRLHPFTGVLIVILIAAPWHILAALRNPPLFAFTLQSGPGQYHGFLWNYFIKEQVLRFLNRRYPRDYDTVPRLWFWLLHLVWLFPWTVYLPAVSRLSFKPIDRVGRTRLLALCWVGFILLFFTFSTTQEYYSMPSYPAFALLLGAAIAAGGSWVRGGTRALGIIAGLAAAASFTVLLLLRHVPTPGDISAALIHNPKGALLSMGPMLDLTFDSFAYLRIPLALAGTAFLVGALGAFWAGRDRVYLTAALMMVLFFHAARLALVTFDPFLSSRPLAEALVQSPDGQLIAQGFYYQFSSVFFYANRKGLLLSPKRANLEYGSFAPGAVSVFIDDPGLQQLWHSSKRFYLLAPKTALPHYADLVGGRNMTIVAESGGKDLITNLPLITGAVYESPTTSPSK